MIEVKDLKKIYRMGDTEVRALDGVSLRVEPGEFVAIMGPSGSGKSTLMHLLGLLDHPDSGSYRLLGAETAHLDEDGRASLRARTIGFVFQQFNLLPRTSAAENAALPLLYVPGEPSREDLERPGRLLQEVGLGNRQDHTPAQLSGGQQQRVAIARALVNQPSIIFADEPTGNLDSRSQEEILGLLKDLNARGITVIIVTHEEEVAEHARRVIRMRDGKVVKDTRQRGSAPAVLKGGARAKKPSARAAKPDVSRRFSLLQWTRDVASYFKQAGRALGANKVRTFLSVLGILIGVAAVIAMLALGAGAKAAIESQISSLGSNLLIVFPGQIRQGGVSMGSGVSSRFTLDDAAYIKSKVPMASVVSPACNGRAQITWGGKNYNPQQTQGVGFRYPELHPCKPAVGRFFREDEQTTRARVCVLGLKVANQLFDGKNPVGEQVRINRVAFEVVGVLAERGSSGFRDDNDVVLVPVTTAMARLFGKEYVDNFELQIAKAEDMGNAQDRLRECLRQRFRLAEGADDTFQIMDLSDIRKTVTATSNALSLLLASIAGISLLVGGIGIMNIMLVTVTERTREIGLRKALGARRKDILSQFLVEAITVSLVGGLGGILVGSTIAFGLSTFAGWTAPVSLVSVLLSVGFSAVVGVVFGLWPAQKASQLDPIEALRYE